MPETPEENPAEQMMSRFRRQKDSTRALMDLHRVASNINQATYAAAPVPRELRQKSQNALTGVATALAKHLKGEHLAEVMGHLTPAVGDLTSVGHAIFSLGKEVHQKLENASAEYPGMYSDVMDTAIGVPNEHLDRFTTAANKGN